MQKQRHCALPFFRYFRKPQGGSHPSPHHNPIRARVNKPLLGCIQCCLRLVASSLRFVIFGLEINNKFTENGFFFNRRLALEICVVVIIFVISVSPSIRNDPEAIAVMEKWWSLPTLVLTDISNASISFFTALFYWLFGNISLYAFILLVNSWLRHLV